MSMMNLVAIVIASLLALGTGEVEQASAAEPPSHPAPEAPELTLSLRDAIEAALDQNPKVRLFKERIEAARGVKRTQLGALLPNLAGSVNYYNMNFFLGKIGGSPVTTPAFDIFDARGNFTQSLFSWSLIQKWRASRERKKRKGRKGVGRKGVIGRKGGRKGVRNLFLDRAGRTRENPARWDARYGPPRAACSIMCLTGRMAACSCSRQRATMRRSNASWGRPTSASRCGRWPIV
jgi:hypothetical protein